MYFIYQVDCFVDREVQLEDIAAALAFIIFYEPWNRVVVLRVVVPVPFIITVEAVPQHAAVPHEVVENFTILFH